MDTVVMCTGFAQAARLVGEVLVRRGVRRIAIENPGHAEQCADLRATGLDLVPVPVDEAGLRVDALASLDVGAVLITPAHQYPTGAVLDPTRRAALLDWAARRRAFVLEDDYDAEYRYDREPVGALQGLAPDRVIYVGSASKVLAPSLRQGWLIVPTELLAGVRQAKLSADRGSPALEQLALASFIDAGDLDRHLRRTRAIYRRRRDALVEAMRAHIPRARLIGVAAGLHVLAELPRRLAEQQAVGAATRERVRVYGASIFQFDPKVARPALLLGYGGIAEHAIERGVKRLARALA
jgi:GntR family transcriptional regulator/MocR family aminotransferase